MLSSAGLKIDIVPADINEEIIKKTHDGLLAEDLSHVLAREKAASVSTMVEDALVIGADQILECGDRLYDKPVGDDGVRAHLISLRGQTHRLISSACIIKTGEMLWHKTETAKLTMRQFDDSYIENYIQKVGREVQSSVGAYHIEGMGIQLFERIEGDYFVILGLPLLSLLDFLRKQKILIS